MADVSMQHVGPVIGADGTPIPARASRDAVKWDRLHLPRCLRSGRSSAIYPARGAPPAYDPRVSAIVRYRRKSFDLA